MPLDHEAVDNSKGHKPFLIGVAGGTSSGKTTVCEKIMEELGFADVSESQRKVVVISQDSFYKELKTPFTASNNYDHPNALDQDLLEKTLLEVLNGKITQVPMYDYVQNARKEGEFHTIYPADVVLFEGILAFYFPQILELFNMKLFVDTDPDTRLIRRVQRDVQERSRKLDTVLEHYMEFVKPAYEEFCLPTKKHADVIIPRGADNQAAISILVEYLRSTIDEGTEPYLTPRSRNSSTASMRSSSIGSVDLDSASR